MTISVSSEETKKLSINNCNIWLFIYNYENKFREFLDWNMTVNFILNLISDNLTLNSTFKRPITPKEKISSHSEVPTFYIISILPQHTTV